LAVKTDVPDIHIHAFSPEEVQYGARRNKTDVKVWAVGRCN
jgi:2-iminoacetate synthase ThiH